MFTHGLDEKGYCHATFLAVIPQLAARRRIISIQWRAYFAHEPVYQCSGPRARNLPGYHLVDDMAHLVRNRFGSDPMVLVEKLANVLVRDCGAEGNLHPRRR
eukprot:s4530_g2.t1